MARFLLQIVTPERELVKEEVESVIAPAADGYIGIWPNHAPMVANLRIGVLKYRPEKEFKTIALSGGFLEVSENRLIVLADAAERPEEIDTERVRRARERAEKRLRDRQDNIDYERARMALMRAINRLKVAGKED